MKVLLSGIQYYPNQFSRQIESYGLECIHQNGDPGQFLPTDVHAVVIATSQTSHQKMWDVKDHAKRLNVPLFISYTGFSQIKEQFEKWLVEANGIASRKSATTPNSAMAHAFKLATTPPPPTPQLATPQVNKMKLDPSDPSSRRAYANAARDLMLKGHNEGFSARQIKHLLINEGFKTNSKGDEWQEHNIYQTINYNTVKKFKVKAKSRTTTAPTAKLKSPRPDSQMELIQKVMSSKLPKDRKFELVEEISAGLMLTDNTVMVVREEDKIKLVARNIFKEADEDLLMLDIITATAVIQSFKEIKAFVDGE
jgi:hypothetical protein